MRLPDVEEMCSDPQMREYFLGLASDIAPVWPLHEKGGLWEKIDGKHPWMGVSLHTLRGQSRVRRLAELLGLPENLRVDMELGYGCHDITKRFEKTLPVGQGGITWDQYEDQVEHTSKRWVYEAGFNDRVIKLSGAVGHSSLAEADRLSNCTSPKEDALGFLAVHYVDSFTIGHRWVEPSDFSAEGDLVNDLDRRTKKNQDNTTLRNLDQDGFARFQGLSTFEKQLNVGRQIEWLLTKLIGDRIGSGFDPINLPEFVDFGIMQRIALLPQVTRT